MANYAHKCAVCRSSRRDAIEQAISSGGKTDGAVGRLFDLSMDTIRRHKINHMATPTVTTDGSIAGKQ